MCGDPWDRLPLWGFEFVHLEPPTYPLQFIFSHLALFPKEVSALITCDSCIHLSASSNAEHPVGLRDLSSQRTEEELLTLVCSVLPLLLLWVQEPLISTPPAVLDTYHTFPKQHFPAVFSNWVQQSSTGMLVVFNHRRVPGSKSIEKYWASL